MLECLLAAHWHAIARAATEDDPAALLCLRRTCRTLHTMLSYEMPMGMGDDVADALIRPLMLERALREGDAAWALTLAAKPRPRQDTLAADSTLGVLQRVKSGEIIVRPSVLVEFMAGLMGLRLPSTINDPVAVMARSLAAMRDDGAADAMAAIVNERLPILYSRRCGRPGCVKTDFRPISWALCPHCDYMGYCSPACRAADLAHRGMHDNEEGSRRGARMPDKSLVFEHDSPFLIKPLPRRHVPTINPATSSYTDDDSGFSNRRWIGTLPHQRTVPDTTWTVAPPPRLLPPPPVQPLVPAAAPPPPEPPIPDRAQRLAMGDYPAKLWEHLRERSAEKESFAVASLEWLPVGITTTDMDDVDCPCGHRHIHQLCHIRNRLTEAEATVGCDCIKWFDYKLADMVKFAQTLMKIRATYVGPSDRYNDCRQLDFRLYKERKAFSANDVFRTFYARVPWLLVADKWHLYVNDARTAPAAKPLEPNAVYSLRLHVRSSPMEPQQQRSPSLILDLIGVERVLAPEADDENLPDRELVQLVGALSAAVPGHLAHTSNSSH